MSFEECKVGHIGGAVAEYIEYADHTTCPCAVMEDDRRSFVVHSVWQLVPVETNAVTLKAAHECDWVNSLVTILSKFLL